MTRTTLLKKHIFERFKISVLLVFKMFQNSNFQGSCDTFWRQVSGDFGTLCEQIMKISADILIQQYQIIY